MPKGGKRAGAGRKQGVANKKTYEIANKAAESGLTPLEHMLGVLRDEAAPMARRDDMAKCAAPFMHPRLAPANATAPGAGAIRDMYVLIVNEGCQVLPKEGGGWRVVGWNAAACEAGHDALAALTIDGEAVELKLDAWLADNPPPSAEPFAEPPLAESAEVDPGVMVVPFRRR